MKITKIEMEMSEKKNAEFLGLDRASEGCNGSCKNCPLSQNNNTAECSVCFIRYTEVPFNIKVIKEPLVLTEGMDCSGLQLRDGRQVLGAFKATKRLLRVISR